MRMKRLDEDKWVSSKQKTEEFDYWLIIELFDMYEACGQDKPKYIAEVSVVSPDLAGPENVAIATEYCGLVDLSDLAVVECLHGYGIRAVCDTFKGNNRREVLRAAKHALNTIAGLLGFFLDGPQNPIGHSGWDCLKGDFTLETAQANRERWGSQPPKRMHVVE